MEAVEFDRLIESAPKREDRIAWFGALLAKESQSRVEIVGGSAIEIYLSSSEYISQDVDLVGDRERVESVFRRWKFRKVEGRSQRVYWFKETIGLVDIVGAGDSSGLRPRRIETPQGPVWVSAVEPLIAHRLSRAHREKSEALLDQAVRLAEGRKLDWEYLETMAKYEGAISLLKQLRKKVMK